MAELGALTLRIQEEGGDAVLRKVTAIDAAAKKTGITAETAAAALGKLGIQAKAAGGNIAVAAGQTQQATQILQKLGFTGQVVTQQTTQLTQATTQLARAQTQVAPAAAAATQRLSMFGREVVTSTGRLSAFSTRAITGLNAAAFAISGLASGGVTSFRSLASAAAGFAAFFGPGGAIASIGITAGLAITDFFTRTRREIEETAKKAKEEVAKLRADIEQQRRGGDQPGLIERNRQATLNLAEAQAELVEIKKILDPLDQREAELKKAAPGVSATVIDAWEKENATLRERRAALDLLIPRLTQEIALTKTAALNIREPAQPRGPTGIQVTAAATRTAAEAEKERQEQIAKTVAALVELSKANRLTGEDLFQLQLRYAQLSTESTVLRDATLALEQVTTDGTKSAKQRAVAADQLTAALARQAEIAKQLAAIDAASLQRPAVRDIKDARNVFRASDALTAGFGPREAARFIDPAKMNERLAQEAAKSLGRIPNIINPRLEELRQAVADGLASALAAGIAQGFAQGLGEGGIGEGFKQMAAQLAQGLGSVAVDYGLKAILTAERMAAIAKFLVANPLLAIGAGIALVALGRALGGRSSGVGGSAGGFSGGSPSASTAPLSIRRLVVDPNAGRQQVGPSLSRIDSSGIAAAAHPLAGVQLLAVDKPAGAEYLARRVDSYNARRA